MIEMLEPDAAAEKFLRSPIASGGSVIVAPNSRIIAGPWRRGGHSLCECNLELGIR